MKSTYWYIIAFLYVVFSIYLFYRYNNNKELLENSLLKFEISNSILKRNLIKNVKYNKPISLSDNLLIVDESGNKKKFTKEFNSGKFLFLKISENNCDFCVESALNTLVDFQKKTNIKLPVVVLKTAESNSVNSLRALGNRFNNKFKFYYIETEKFGNTNIESLNLPYFFIFSNGKYHGGLFLPDAKDRMLTKDYLRAVKTIF